MNCCFPLCHAVGKECLYYICKTVLLYLHYDLIKQETFFLAKYLIKLNKSSLQTKRSMFGNALFEKLQKLKEDHARQGQYFLEYLLKVFLHSDVRWMPQ